MSLRPAWAELVRPYHRNKTITPLKGWEHRLSSDVNGAGSVCDQKTSKFFVPWGRIQGRTRGCKWNLLNIRKGKHKGKHGWAQVETGS
jgi:hypothetical protein